MTKAEVRYVAQEMILGALINMAITLGMTWVVFHSQSEVPVWAMGGLIMDMVPSTVMPCVMMCVMLTLVTRRKLGASLAPAIPSVRLPWVVRMVPRHLVLRTGAVSVGFAVVSVALFALAFGVSDIALMALTSVYVVKAVFAALLGAAATWVIVTKALAD